jgi:hypothetical protein
MALKVAAMAGLNVAGPFTVSSGASIETGLGFSDTTAIAGCKLQGWQSKRAVLFKTKAQSTPSVQCSGSGVSNGVPPAWPGRAVGEEVVKRNGPKPISLLGSTGSIGTQVELVSILGLCSACGSSLCKKRSVLDLLVSDHLMVFLEGIWHGN